MFLLVYLSILLYIGYMEKIIKSCLVCSKSFTPDKKSFYKDLKNAGKFCSNSCSAVFNNANRPLLDLECVVCSNIFKSKSKSAKYCSHSCKNTRSLKKKYKSRTYLNYKVSELLNDTSCSNCSWNLETCDIHHIIPKKLGGSDDFNNLVILCPNCHRLADRGKLTIFKTVQSMIDK